MKIPAEVHLFADRGHGFMGDPNKGENGTAYDHWLDRVCEFLRQMDFDGRLGKPVDLMTRYAKDDARGEYRKEPIWPNGRMQDAQPHQCQPYLEWHFPKERKTKAIQIIYSGGGYGNNNPDWFEVTPVRRYLNEKGMTVVTMKYRTPRPKGGTGQTHLRLAGPAAGHPHGTQSGNQGRTRPQPDWNHGVFRRRPPHPDGCNQFETKVLLGN